MNKGIISEKELLKVKKCLSKDLSFKLACNAVTRGDLQDVAMNWDRFSLIDHTFSHVVTPELSATSQHHSGRCWIFSALNLIRIPFAKKYKLEDFEFSQSYLFFFDKLERTNYFLENILSTSDMPVDGRLVSHLLKDPVQDGGQWDMFVSLIQKYGIVPKSIFPDSKASLNSRSINYILSYKLREWAKTLRDLKEKKASDKTLSEKKDLMMNEAFRIISIHIGHPPEKFDWEYVDKDKKFHACRNLTPKTFFKKHVNFPLDEMVSLVNSPRKSTPYGKSYTVKYLGNVIEGQIVRYLNVETHVMKKAAIAAIKDNSPVWIGCDVGKFFHRGLGVMDAELYEYKHLYDTEFDLDKGGRLDYGEAQIAHAMLFTGVNLVNGKPTKWRVENSWGEKNGDKGYYIMTDKWFDEFMFLITVHKKYLTKKLQDEYKAKPQVVPPWDPLGD
ncbi:MAG: Aminopeptidase C [Chlamydiia bacterium]|nr:Aminopeptidase C [Chlamydiia bacterium]